MRLFEKEYYASLISALLELIAIITGMVFARKYITGVFFLAYLIFDFFLAFYAYYLQLSSSFNQKEYDTFLDLTNPVVSLIELLVYYNFSLLLLKARS
jgi:hypothetical protein